MKTIISGKVTKEGSDSMEEITIMVESEEGDTSVDTATAYNATIDKLTEEE